jgi:hypothetical protein
MTPNNAITYFIAEFEVAPVRQSSGAGRSLAQYSPEISPVPLPPELEDVIDVIDGILDGSITDPPPGIYVDKTDTAITITVQSTTPPTTQQLADIGVKAALTIPGATSATPKYENGEIVIYVTLGNVRAILSRWLSTYQAKYQDIVDQRSGRSLLQTSSTTEKTRYVVVGNNKVEVERYQRQLDNLLKNSTAMTDISNSVVNGSTAEVEVQVPSPPPPPKIACSFSGDYLITPLYAPCNKYYMAYVYPNCANTDVSLRTRRQLGSKPKRAVWRILGAYWAPNTTVPTTITASERGACPARYLQESGTLVGVPQKEWIFTPSGKGNDCSEVNIFSVSKGAYLSVPRSCNSISYASSDGGRARFKLRQV